MSDTVLSNVDKDGNATVVLNRPDVHNAFDEEMVAALTRTLKTLEADSRVRAVVLMGHGKSFSAGADINRMRRTAGFTREHNLKDALEGAEMFYTLYTLKKPTIARVHGAARGGGVGLVAACDIAIASRDATFRLSEVRLGIVPAVISPYVVAAIGSRKAHRYFLSGEEFDAAEAYRIGLIHDLVEEEELNATIGRVLAELYSGGPQAIVAAKQLIGRVVASPIDRAMMENTAQYIADVRANPEAREGLTAFLEKRRPAWLALAPAGEAAPGPARGKRRARHRPAAGPARKRGT
ncbi:MAG: enoyl-CoA hydratase/isomerase family protein [Betaproteobacteria bacterium]|nr:enoyl-CoA hydratase/isomerase family protein [Betaproteobacteria bacterium]